MKMPWKGPSRHRKKCQWDSDKRKCHGRVPLDKENKNASGNLPKSKKCLDFPKMPARTDFHHFEVTCASLRGKVSGLGILRSCARPCAYYIQITYPGNTVFNLFYFGTSLHWKSIFCLFFFQTDNIAGFPYSSPARLKQFITPDLASIMEHPVCEHDLVFKSNRKFRFW